jgi:hypothetical protein
MHVQTSEESLTASQFSIFTVVVDAFDGGIKKLKNFQSREVIDDQNHFSSCASCAKAERVHSDDDSDPRFCELFLMDIFTHLFCLPHTDLVSDA